MNLNPITMQLVADKYIRFALEEDIHSEDVSTNAVMPEYRAGEVELICKQDGVIAGLPVFERVFTMLDASTKVEWAKNQDGREVKDGDAVKKGQVLLILEAMKMENEIMAPKDGTITSVNVQNGSTVESVALLVTIG